MPSVERMRPLLGTFVTIRAEGTANALEAALQSAFHAVAQVDRLMSFHRRTSDIGRLNRARAGTSLRVHRWTYHVLSEAQRLRSWSGGAFDCNVGGALMRSGLLPALPCHPRARGHSTHCENVLSTDHSIRLRARVALDLGGIAKGFAVDKAVEALQQHDIANGAVNAGGDLRVFGREPQPVWVRLPQDPTRVRLIGMLTNGAIATSAAYFIGATTQGAAASAIVDAATARRVSMSHGVSVMARNAMLADALTKVAVLKGRLPARIAWYAQARILRL